MRTDLGPRKPGQTVWAAQGSSLARVQESFVESGWIAGLFEDRMDEMR